MSDLLKQLNPEQAAAVTLPAEHALILAGAGSGKTRVLTTRIAWLVSAGLVGPHGVLAVTFTNKAAKEMLARLTAMLPINTRGLWIGTFHGLCNRLLRTHHREAGLPELFQILDTADQLSAIKRLLKNLNVDLERFPPRELQHFINAHKEKGVRAAAAEAFDDYTRRRVALYADYEAQCQREGVADFAELLLRAYELLARNEPLRAHYQARFRHILVDEFQDTNQLQYRWIKLLAKAGASDGACVFAVGDDDQSIYGFRGAEVGNLRDFEREFAVRHVIRLEQNYRSHGNILDAANAIITQNQQRLGKNLWTDAGAGEPIRIFDAFSDIDEARWIVDEANALIRDGVSPDHIAVLYRSNAQSRVIEHELFNRGVPYRVYGGLRFFERQEVKHALAYLRLIANPDDDTAFLRVVNFPARGIGSRSVESLQAAAHQGNSSLYNAAASLSGAAATRVAAFVRLVESLRQGSAGMVLPEIVEHVIEHSGLRGHYLNEKEGQDRLDNLDELINATANFVGEQTSGEIDASTVSADLTLAAFLSHAALEAGDHQADAEKAALQLMTVHAAKGLEFEVVFIGGLEQGLFPHDNALNDRDGLEEERRLMYVAVTRARRRLNISHAQTRMLHGQTRYSVPSLFLGEIPEPLVRRVNRVAPRPEATHTVSGRGRIDSPAVDSGGERFRVGQNVMHAKFGAGVIVAAEGRGGDARVQVNFRDAGMKWLALDYARLTAA